MLLQRWMRPAVTASCSSIAACCASRAQCLDIQRQGLAHLQEVIRKDTRDLEIMFDLLGQDALSNFVKDAVESVTGPSSAPSAASVPAIAAAPAPGAPLALPAFSGFAAATPAAPPAFNTSGLFFK